MGNAELQEGTQRGCLKESEVSIFVAGEVNTSNIFLRISQNRCNHTSNILHLLFGYIIN